MRFDRSAVQFDQISGQTQPHSKSIMMSREYTVPLHEHLKTRGRVSGAIPMPESVTAMITSLANADASMAMHPFAGVNLAALISKLVMTCNNRARST
jgi:precorrin-4 methylase